VADMRLKNDASTETRLTSRRAAAASRTTSCPKHKRPSPIGQQQRGECPHEGRLARPVLAEHGHAFATRDRERHVSQRRDGSPLSAAAAVKRLLQMRDFNCEQRLLLEDDTDTDQRPRRRSAEAVNGSPSEQHRRPSLAPDPGKVTLLFEDWPRRSVPAARCQLAAYVTVKVVASNGGTKQR
jgi:hypothetical protein